MFTRLGRVRTKTLGHLIDRDHRITDVSLEGADGVFIYTRSAEWDDGNGSGTFRGDSETDAVRNYLDRVQRNTEGRY